MTFWLLAAAIPALTALLLFRPLLRRGGAWLGVALACLLLLPVTTLLLYQGVGRPDALAAPEPVVAGAAPADMNVLVAQLRERMQSQPDDLEGWLLLGRSYRSMQRYDDALETFIRARELAPDNPVVAVELAEALVFTSPPGAPDPQVAQLLDEALAVAPDLQKGLWLSGMLAAQGGDDERALARWNRLLALLERGSAVAASVQQQIDAARSRLGEPPAEAWAGLEVVVQAPDSLPSLGPEAALFLIARDPAAPNPPLGAVRVIPAFPARIRLSDANAMMPQRPISGVAELELLARLAPDGNPVGGENPIESEPVTVSRDRDTPIELRLGGDTSIPAPSSGGPAGR